MEKSSKGGVRKGAGRPAGRTKTASIQLKITPLQKEQILEMANEKNQPLNRFILSSLGVKC